MARGGSNGVWRAVLFDLYETLVHTVWPGFFEMVAQAAGVESDALTESYKNTRPERSVGAFPDRLTELRIVLAAAGANPTADQLASMLRVEAAAYATKVTLYPDALPCIRSLRSAGIPVALISNCGRATRGLVNQLRLQDEFDTTLLSCEAGIAKPDQRIYTLALEQLGVPPGPDILFVDDRPDYCDGAAELGLATRLILRPDEGVPDTTGGHEVVKDLEFLSP